MRHNFNKKSFTIIEYLVSILLLGIIVFGGMAFYFYSNQHYQTALHRRVAVELATSKLEEIRRTVEEIGINGLPCTPVPCEVKEEVYIMDMRGTSTVSVDNDIPDSTNDYKHVKAEVTWTAGGPQLIALDTYIYIAP